MIEARTYLIYQRQLANLSIQEGRLRRQAEKGLAAIEALQRPRLIQIQSRLNTVAKAYIIAVHHNQYPSFDPEALGLQFTLEQIEVRVIELEPESVRRLGRRTGQLPQCYDFDSRSRAPRVGISIDCHFPVANRIAACPLTPACS